MLAVKRDTQAAIKTIGFKAHESNRSEETQLSSHRPSAPTCPATHTGQFRRHGIFLLLQSPTCYHRMHRDTFNYIHHVTALHRIVKHQNVQKCSEDHSFWTFWLSNVRFATAPGNFSTVERQKVLRRLQFFKHFDFQMCFSPQRRAIFRHLNRQKWSKHAVFCTFWLSNVLFATAACNFLTSEQTKVLRSRHVLYILTFKCAFRHSGVQFFDIGTSKCPNMRCFVHFDLQMCFSPQRRAIFDFASEHRPPHPPL